MAQEATAPPEKGQLGPGGQRSGLVVDLLESTAVSLSTRRSLPEQRQGPPPLPDALDEVLIDRPLAAPQDLDALPRRAARVTGPPPSPAMSRPEVAPPPRPRTATEQFQSLPPAEAVIVAPAAAGFWARAWHLALAATVGLALGVGGGLYAVIGLQPDRGQEAARGRAISGDIPQPRVVSLAPKVELLPSLPGTDHIVGALARAEVDLRRIRWLSTTDRERMLRLRLHIERQQWGEAIGDDGRLPRYLQRLSIACLWRAEVAAARGQHERAAELLSEVAARRALSRHLRVRALVALSEAFLAQNRAQPARDAAQRAVSWARRSGNKTLQAMASAQLARSTGR